MVSDQVVEEFPDITLDQRVKLFELLSEADAADREVLTIKESLKEAKEESEEAQVALRRYLRKLRGDQDKTYPLFDSNLASLVEVAINPPVTPEEEPDRPWRKVLLETLFSGVALKRLQDANLETVGDMADFTNNSRITEIEGIGQATADKIEKRMVEYWAENPVDL